MTWSHTVREVVIIIPFYIIYSKGQNAIELIIFQFEKWNTISVRNVMELDNKGVFFEPPGNDKN